MRSKPSHPSPIPQEEIKNAETLASLQTRPTLQVFRLSPLARLPERSHLTDVGFDVFAHLLSESGRELSRAIHQRGCTVVETGLVVKAPPGHYVQVCSRSGLALRGVFVANSPGIIDPDYTGELKIILFNGSYMTHYVSHGHRIAQLVLAPLPNFSVEELHEAPKTTERGDSGFGSTGN